MIKQLKKNLPFDLCKLILSFVPNIKCKFCHKVYLNQENILLNSSYICNKCILCNFNFRYFGKKRLYLIQKKIN